MIRSFLFTSMILATATASLTGCGSDDTQETATSTTSTTATSGQGGSGGSASTSGQGGSSSDAASTASSSSSSASSASSSASSTAASSSSGGGDPSLNGCTLATAKDMTNQKQVIVTDVSPWTFGHSACIIVTAGTQVVWKGDFGAHPLAGGEAGKADIASPISMAKPNGGQVTVSIPVDADKAYPYFCLNHPSMKGVVYAK